MQTVKTTLQCLAAGALFALAGCELPPPDTQQVGYRGQGMVDVQNSTDPMGEMAYPTALPAASSAGPKAGEVYQNVQVLGDLSVAEFTRLMTTITAWVSPEQGCNYCHNPANLASDDIYTKVVSRRMIQMTQNINAEWGDHVAPAGVNCYTCHRGNNVPEYIWFSEVVDERHAVGWRNGQNRAAEAVGYTSMPSDPFTHYLTSKDASAVRVASNGPFPTNEHNVPIQETEMAYAFMISWSQALDVNCTYCHQTASFRSWDISTPARVKAWHGLQMARAVNEDYLIPLGPEYPANRLGASGDAPKAYCATCHQGQAKPLNGADAVSAYPSLTGGT
jgi:photosynthetic reaction center cytochrome c subunit